MGRGSASLLQQSCPGGSGNIPSLPGPPPPTPAGGLAPPLFLHVPSPSASSDRRLSEGTFEREWEQRVAAVFRSQVGLVERYSDPGEPPGVGLPACLPACLPGAPCLSVNAAVPCSLLLPRLTAAGPVLRTLCLLPCRLPGRAADEGEAHAGAEGRHPLQCGEARQAAYLP